MRRAALPISILILSGGVLTAAPPPGVAPPIRIVNIMTGTNKLVETPLRIGRAEITGDEFCRVKYEQNGTALEMVPIKNGKTRIWLYDAVDGKAFQELRINVCTRQTMDLYDRYAATYRTVEGLVVDIQDNRLTFAGQIFSMNAFQQITQNAAAEGFSAEGLTLHPYVNAVLAEPPNAIGPPPTRDPSAGEPKAATP